MTNPTTRIAALETALAGCRDALNELAKQARLHGDSGHAAVAQTFADNAHRVLIASIPVLTLDPAQTAEMDWQDEVSQNGDDWDAAEDDEPQPFDASYDAHLTDEEMAYYEDLKAAEDHGREEEVKMHAA